MTFTQTQTDYLKKIGLSPEATYHPALGTVFRDAPQDPLRSGKTRPLMPHQAINLHEMARREKDEGTTTSTKGVDFTFKSSRIGIFTDDVGTGKSDTILRLIKDYPTIERLETDYEIDQTRSLFKEVSLERTQNKIEGTISWLVVPHGIFRQWTDLINLYKMPFIRIRDKADLSELVTKFATSLWLISSTRYRELVTAWWRVSRDIRPRMLARLVVDECDSIIVPCFPEIPSVFYWFVTSSIQNIFHPIYNHAAARRNGGSMSTGVRSQGFIKNSLVAVNDKLKHVIVKCDHKFVQECLDLPDPFTRFIKVRQSIVGEALTGVVPTSVLSMVNANDLDAVASHYNISIVSSPVDLIKQVVKSLQVTLYDTVHQETQTLATRKKIDELKRRINVISDRIKGQTECNICLNPMEPEDDDEEPVIRPTLTPCCQSIWCLECIIRSLNVKSECPKCKQHVDPKTLISVGENVDLPVESSENKEIYDTKEEALKYLLTTMKNSSEVHRVLIFSEYEGGFDPIISICDKMNIVAKQLKGTGATISKRIKEWETTTKCTVLLLNACRFGAGLNLQAGTDIILWHKLAAKVKGDSDLENQVLGRVIRYGLDHQPYVWKLQHPGEY